MISRAAPGQLTLTGRRPRILFVGHGMRATGRSRVSHSIIGRLLGHCEVIQFAPNWYGAGRTHPWVILPNTVPGDPLGHTQLAAVVRDAQPDTIVLSCECWEYGRYAPALSRLRGRRVILHIPVEGPLARRWPAAAVGLPDVVVTCTEFGRRQLQEAMRPMSPGTAPVPRVTVIPHGVDTSRFHPLAAAGRGAPSKEVTPDSLAALRRSSAARARRILFGTDGPSADAFVILNANRSNGRKRLDLTLAAFDRFARDKPPGVRLCLQADVRPREFPDATTYTRLTGNGRILQAPSPCGSLPALSDERMNLLYNVCDVGINTAAAEAWGLVSLEHAATGAAQIMPALSTCQELWDGAATLVPAGHVPTPPGEWFGYHAADPDGLATAMERLYRNRELLEQVSWSCFARATRPQWSWDSAAAQWRELMLGGQI